VTRRPSPFQNHPDPMVNKVVPTEGGTHPAYGQVGQWIEDASKKEPSAGAIGRMELLRAWDQLPADGRKALVKAARVLLAREAGEVG
jgi:hypothetical protein